MNQPGKDCLGEWNLDKNSSRGQRDVGNCSSTCWCSMATWEFISRGYLLVFIQIKSRIVGLVNGTAQRGKGELCWDVFSIDRHTKKLEKGN